MGMNQQPLDEHQELLEGLLHAVEQAPPEPEPHSKVLWRAWADTQLRARTAAMRKQHALTLAIRVSALAEATGARVVGLYSPLGAEVETRELANRLLVLGLQLAYPRLSPDSKSMKFAAAEGPSALQPRPRSRLLEPVGLGLHAEELDLVVVPAMAVNAQGQRLGRGGGHFDRYLPNLRADVLTVAVCPQDQIVPWQPTEPHDWPLKLVCTEHGLFQLG